MDFKIQTQKNTPKPEIDISKLKVSEEDQQWFLEKEAKLASFSPFLPTFITDSFVFDSLFKNLSETLLTNRFPDFCSHYYKTISLQFNDEPVQWVSMFSNYLQTVPDFIFNSDTSDKEYLTSQSRDFLTYMYTPLSKQFNILVNDIITYNYSPFKISCELFKKR